MEIGVIPILADSHSHPHVLFNSCPISMGLPRDSHSHWDSQSHAHLYREAHHHESYTLVVELSSRV